RRAVIARQRVQVFKPVIDDRFATDEVVSRDDRRLKAHAVATSAELLSRVEIGVQVVGIDEVQFFDAGVVDVAMQLADAGIRVIAAGLVQDYMRRPFGQCPRCLRLRKKCRRCTRSAFAAAALRIMRSAFREETRRSKSGTLRTKRDAVRATSATRRSSRTRSWLSS